MIAQMWKRCNARENIAIFNMAVFEASDLQCYLQLYNKTPCKVLTLQWTPPRCKWMPQRSSLKLRDKEEEKGCLCAVATRRRNIQINSKQASWGMRSSQSWNMELRKGYLCGIHGKTDLWYTTQVQPASITGFTSKLGLEPSSEKSWSQMTVFLQN